jgi:ATP-dependent exoDNAse (exonuclease V) beta subunit
MSDVRSKFSTADMIVKSKSNYANRLAKFVLQTVSENKMRHEALQRFFIANDSCTVATEVPVYIRKEDVTYMENVLKFKISDDQKIELKGKKKIDMPRLLTGHIDLIQIRNGQVHIMDYKPNAAKERPIEQLTWYALALSRLTGLRLFEFTCAWFDEKDYYQFFPLHVVKKIQTKTAKPRKRTIQFKDGTKVEVPRENQGKVVIV